MRGAKFLVDYHLQKLGRWLRFLGQDVEILNNRLIPSDIISKMRKEEYIFLTRDNFWEGRSEIERVHIESDFLEEQLKQLIKQKLIKIDKENILKRCSECNYEIEKVDKESVKERIPPKTYLWLDEYWQCKNCGKLYWRGTHLDRIKRILSRLSDCM